MSEAPVRIATWSGPRSISTALLRAWENRPDTWVCDEPLYAHYLQATGIPHPGAEEVIRRHDPDWRHVAAGLTGPVPHGRRIFYQKHMAHHLLPEMGREWVAGLTNAFLIREPREMLVSLLKVYPGAELADTGLPQQVELFEAQWRRTGRVPTVLDARDVLEDPAGTLSLFCREVGVPFLESMLAWPAGPRATDGVWARHWYAAVERSTGFEPYIPRDEPVPPLLEGLLAECRPLYGRLHAFRLRPV